MRKFNINITIGFPGAEIDEEFEVEDDASDEEIEKEAKTILWNHVEWRYTEIL